MILYLVIEIKLSDEETLRPRLLSGLNFAQTVEELARITKAEKP
jgi:hypothetical protein